MVLRGDAGAPGEAARRRGASVETREPATREAARAGAHLVHIATHSSARQRGAAPRKTAGQSLFRAVPAGQRTTVNGLHTAEVTGSSPVTPTGNARVSGPEPPDREGGRALEPFCTTPAPQGTPEEFEPVARVVDLERHRVEKLAARIGRRLAALPPMSRLHVPLSEVDDPERWRRAARLAAHRLGCGSPRA